MLNRTTADLFDTIKALSGVNDFTTEETANLVDLANRRFTMAYNTSPMWDRYVAVGEERNLSSFEVSRATFENGLYFKYGTELVGSIYNDVYVPTNQDNFAKENNAFRKGTDGRWIFGSYSYTKDPVTNIVTFIGGTTQAKQQDTDSTGAYIEYGSPTEVIQWGDFVGLTNFKLTPKQTVEFSEKYEVFNSEDTRETKEQITDFIRIHREQPFLNRSATEYDFFVDSFGANVLSPLTNESSTVYVTYKKPIDPANNPSTGIGISSFTIGSIPSEFFNYISHGTYADFLRMDGQHDKAAFEEQKADLFLATELERIDIINNNNSLNHKISTYVNRSTR